MLSVKYVARKIPTLIKFMRGRKYFPSHRPCWPRPSRCPLHKRDREHVKRAINLKPAPAHFASNPILFSGSNPEQEVLPPSWCPHVQGFSHVNIHPCPPPGPARVRVQSIKRANRDVSHCRGVPTERYVFLPSEWTFSRVTRTLSVTQKLKCRRWLGNCPLSPPCNLTTFESGHNFLVESCSCMN